MANPKYKYTTRQFPQTAAGQATKVKTIEQLEGQDWEVSSEVLLPGQVNAGKACVLLLACFPAVFFAWEPGQCVVSFRKETKGEAE